MILVVTGSNRGIGAAIAKAGARQGYKVVVNHVNASAEAAAVVRDIEAEGGRALAVEADVTDAADIDRLFATTDREFGPVTALVNNVGGGGAPTQLLDITDQDLRRVFGLNIFSTILCTQAAVRRMSTREGGKGGAIVNISSLAAVRPDNPGLSLYASAKGAVDSFTYAAAREFADLGVRINVVRAGIIDTPSHDVTKGVTRARVEQTVMIKRAGRPQEVADAALFLLSSAASYITGTTLNVSGGR